MATLKKMIEAVEGWPWKQPPFCVSTQANKNERTLTLCKTADDRERVANGFQPHHSYWHVTYEQLNDAMEGNPKPLIELIEKGIEA